jgi:hypothetical protein
MTAARSGLNENQKRGNMLVALRSLVLGFGLVVVGCGAAERAAARDPRRCEQDPACAKARGVYADCTQQCNDDPECIDRCRQAQPDLEHP